MLSLWRAAFGPVACRAPLRCFVRPASGESVSQSAWRIVDYNGPEGLELADDLPLPPLQFPDQVLVEVKAASVNPLDLWMTGNAFSGVSFSLVVAVSLPPLAPLDCFCFSLVVNSVSFYLVNYHH